MHLSEGGRKDGGVWISDGYCSPGIKMELTISLLHSVLALHITSHFEGN